MSKLALRGVRIEGIKLKMDGDGRIQYDLELSADYTDKLAEQMEWLPSGEDDAQITTYLPPARQTQAKFDNKLTGSNMIVVPNKEDLREAHEMDITILTVSKFKYTHEFDENTGAPKNRRVEFHVTTIHDDLHIPVVAFIKALNTGGLTSKCTITYSEPEASAEDDPQTELPGIEKPRGRKKGLEVVQ